MFFDNIKKKLLYFEKRSYVFFIHPLVVPYRWRGAIGWRSVFGVMWYALEWNTVFGWRLWILGRRRTIRVFRGIVRWWCIFGELSQAPTSQFVRMIWHDVVHVQTISVVIISSGRWLKSRIKWCYKMYN